MLSTARIRSSASLDSGHDLVAGLGEQPGETLAQQDGVLGDHDAHGSSTSDGRPAAWRAGRGEAAVDGGDPVAQAGAGRSRASTAAPPRPSSATSRAAGRPDGATLTAALRGLGVPGHVGEGLGDDEVGDRLDVGSRGRRGAGRRPPSPGRGARGERRQRRVEAASVRTAGWTPRMTLRSSMSASLASSCASSTSAAGASGSWSSWRRARPRFIASETSCCWAPSCRSRSMRRRSASAASTTAARVSRSVLT